MDISVNWLRALAPTIEGSAQDIADALSARAVPVDRVEPVGEGLADVVVARVLEVSRHPDADRLTLCRVDDGSGEILDVVCGAPNVVEGAVYPFIPAGGTLPGGFRIDRRKIRGQISNGMLCSEKELGLGRDAAGIMRLSDEHEPGQPLCAALGLPDARLEVDLTPNRVDLACHVGVARELAPSGVIGVSLPEFGGEPWIPRWSSGESTAEAAGVTIHIEDPDRCFRYLGAVIRGITVGPSPEWLQARLRAAGFRPINNVVDATNYVLLELNQPLHAFDLERIEGPEIRVRAARGEELATLDGGAHELGSEVTVIADARKPVALAGVMGGASSEVTLGTRDILIECAAFDPGHTRRTARATGLATDASYRFERGIDESGLEGAIGRCVELILATAGGRAEPEAARVGRPVPPAARLKLRPSRVRQVLGLRLAAEQIAGLLRPLGFAVDVPATGTTGPLQVEVPGWRVDVREEVDLLEEVARCYGYESFPHEARAFRASVVPDSVAWNRADAVRRQLVSDGFLEARSPSFASERRTSGRPVRLLKPLSEAEAFLRTDLVPVLLGRLEHNWSRGRRDVRLYEIGTVFQRREESGDADLARGDTPFAEEMRVGLVMTGLREPRHWTGPVGDFEFWDLKGILEDLASRLGLGEVGIGTGAGDAVLPFGTMRWLGDDSLCILANGDVVGVAGRVHPDRVDAPVWAGAVWAAEFRLSGVQKTQGRRYRDIPSHPSIARDLAFVIDRVVEAAAVADAMRESAPQTLESLALFDVYEGSELGDGLRSLAWRLVFRAPDRTLTDQEVEEGLGAITDTLKDRFDARIRSS